MKVPILKGKKVILKPLELSQAKSYIRWLKDPEINRFLGADFSDLDFKKEKEFIEKSVEDKSVARWAIYTSEGKHIGSTGLHEIDKKINFKATWGIFIGDKNYWSQGFGTDTLKTVLKYCFGKLKLNRVELCVFPHNPRGKRCYEKCGFKVEGVKRQAIKKNGKFIDDIIMGVIKSDYEQFKSK